MQEGPSGYSDMAADPDGTVYLLYEQVTSSATAPRKQNLIYTSLKIEWLTDGKDRFEAGN